MFAKQTKLATSLFAVCIVGSHSLHAQQDIDDIRDHYYIGLGAGYSFLDPKVNSSAIKLSQDNDFAYKIFAGYQFDDNWSVEAFWSDMGKAK